ncbi:hypothetical protein AVEN_217230-1 [Araneus ventricosus]|uniref:Uncharacterized protein n=1 Tax=Araneus ventricosus TaxID=182803 RepID=A0A4Y2VBW9_ARAVE|nr:hypothetical protein AVEN_217230-1 [Araneus ventricosus]
MFFKTRNSKELIDLLSSNICNWEEALDLTKKNNAKNQRNHHASEDRIPNDEFQNLNKRLHKILTPRWPSGKVSTSGLEVQTPDSTEDPPCMGPVAR